MEFIRYRFLMVLFFVVLNLNANIDGIRIQTIEAKKYGTVHIPLKDKRIKVSNSMFNLGYMKASSATKMLLKDDEYYVVVLEDKYSKGKLHMIIKGKDFKSIPHNIGVLTEISFLLCENFLGKNYNSQKIEETLDEISRKVIKTKGFVLDNKYEINYSDILLYTDGSTVVYKSHREDIKRLEKKIKKGTLTKKDAFEFVYEQKKHSYSIAKNKKRKLKPLYRIVVFLHIPKNEKFGSEIIRLKQLRKGSSPVENFEVLSENIPFRIKKNGSVIISSILKEDSYSFEAVAHTKDGKSNKINFTIVIDSVEEKQFLK